MDNSINVYFDGACEPTNPNGNMGIGFVIYKNGKTLFEYAECIMLGEQGFSSTSNNVAEYYALMLALRWLGSNDYLDNKLLIKGDSKMVIMQMKGEWKMNSGIYMKYAYECREVLKKFKNISLEWIPREFNGYADELSKREMKKRGVEFRIQKG